MKADTKTTPNNTKATANLTPGDNETVHKLTLADCLISEINTRHPKPSDPDIMDLATSIGKFGQTTPGIVRPHPKQPGKYEIGAGSRRRVSCEVAKVKTFAAVIRNLNDDDFEELVLIENSNHVDPDPRAEVRLLERIVKRGVRTPEAISAHLGKPAHWVTRRLKLLTVIPEIRELWEKRNPKRHDPRFDHFTVDMMELVGALSPDAQRMFFKEEQYTPANVRTRAQLHQAIERRLVLRLDKAPFDLNDPATFVPDCGPGCATDTSKQGKLFDFGDRCGHCTNPTCFFARAAKSLANQRLAIVKEHGNRLPIVSRQPAGRIKIGDSDFDPTWTQRITDKPTKENTEKAIVYDAGKLSLGYVRKASATITGPARTVGGQTAGKKSLKDKKEALQARRWTIVHDELLKAIIASKHTDCTENIEDLVAVFGLPFHAEPHDRRDDKNGVEQWQRFDDRKKNGYPLHDAGESYGAGMRMFSGKTQLHKLRQAALWSGLKHVLAGITKGFYKVGEIHHAVPDMRRVAALIKFPIDERKRAADLTIKVPRTWGSGLDVHTLEPVTVKTLQQRLNGATKKPARRKHGSSVVSKR